MLERLVQLIQSLSGSEVLHLSVPVTVKPTSFNTYSIWAVCASPDNHLFVTDDPNDPDAWSQIEGEKPLEVQMVQSLFQRIRFMKQQLQTKEEVTHEL